MFEISEQEERRFAEAGPDRPLAEWTVGEYDAAMDAAGFRDRWRREYEEHYQRVTLPVLEALRSPRPRPGLLRRLRRNLNR
jgi:hypothetical protein